MRGDKPTEHEGSEAEECFAELAAGCPNLYLY